MDSYKVAMDSIRFNWIQLDASIKNFMVDDFIRRVLLSKTIEYLEMLV